MKGGLGGCMALLLCTVGCMNSRITIRYDGLVPDWQMATTQRKYHISSISSGSRQWEQMLGPESAISTSNVYTRAQIRKLERSCPAVFDEEGLPVDVRIEVSYPNWGQHPLWILPYSLLCGSTFGVVPFKQSSQDDARFRVSVSDASEPLEFTRRRRSETWMSSIGLGHLLPFSPLENADLVMSMSFFTQMDDDDTRELQEKTKQLEVRAIAASLAEAERRDALRPAKKCTGRQIGD